jgi:hypothetical protein
MTFDVRIAHNPGADNDIFEMSNESEKDAAHL